MNKKKNFLQDLKHSSFFTEELQSVTQLLVQQRQPKQRQKKQQPITRQQEQPSLASNFQTVQKEQREKELTYDPLQPIKVPAKAIQFPSFNRIQNILNEICSINPFDNYTVNSFQEQKRVTSINREPIQTQNEEEEAKQRALLEKLALKWQNFNLRYSYQKEAKNGFVESAHEVQEHSVQSLFPKSYLNDEVIIFWNQFILDNLTPPKLRNKIHICNTFFLEQLCPSREMQEGIAIQNLRQLTQFFEKRYTGQGCTPIERIIKFDLFSKDFIILPLHLLEHWSCFVICYPSKLLENFLTSPQEQEQKSENQNLIQEQPCILYFDSFGILDERYTTIFRLLLEKEFAIKKSKELKDCSLEKLQQFTVTESNLPAYQIMLPRQPNFFDCGIYMLVYIEEFLRNPTQFMQNIHDPKNWVKLQLFPRKLALQRRDQILEVLKLLKEELPKKDKSIAYYEQERKNILQSCQENPEQEYDVLDDLGFRKFVGESEYQQLEAESAQKLHLKLLDYYINPAYSQNIYLQ